MIKTLSLSPDFPVWSWEHSNGNATEYQMAESYGVLMDYGKCSEFSRHVWNDIVDMTANALAGVGAEWDATYCTADQCKIETRYGILTAKAWNSVAYNIKRLGFVTWKWSSKGYISGYVGRDAFVGFSTHGANCDYLYAWYLFEITKKLNRMIDVLKDEADFSEFERSLKSSTTTIAKLAAPRITATSATLECNSDLSAYLRRNPSMSLGNNVLASETIHDTYMDVLRIAPFISRVSSLTYPLANGIARHTAPLKTFQESVSDYICDAVARHSAPGEYIGEILAPYIAPFNTGHSAPGESIIRCLSDSVQDLKACKIANSESVIRSDSQTDAEAFAGRAKFAGAENMSESASDGVSVVLESLPLQVSAKSNSICFAAARTIGGCAVDSVAQSFSIVEAALSFYTKETWFDPVQSGRNLYIRSVYQVFDEETNVHIGQKFLAAEQDNTNLHLKSVYSANQEESDINIGSIFYEVEQTGNNVHIKSVGSLKGV